MPADRTIRNVLPRVTEDYKPSEADLKYMLKNWVEKVLAPICREQGRNPDDFRPLLKKGAAKVHCRACDLKFEKVNFARKPFRHELSEKHIQCVAHKLQVPVEVLSEGTKLECGRCGNGFTRVDAITRHLENGSCSHVLDKMSQGPHTSPDVSPRPSPKRVVRSVVKTKQTTKKERRARPRASSSRASSSFSESEDFASPYSPSFSGSSSASPSPLLTPRDSPSPALMTPYASSSKHAPASPPYLLQSLPHAGPPTEFAPQTAYGPLAPASHFLPTYAPFPQNGYNALSLSTHSADYMYDAQLPGAPSFNICDPHTLQQPFDVYDYNVPQQPFNVYDYNAPQQPFDVYDHSVPQQPFDYSPFEEQQTVWPNMDPALALASMPIAQNPAEEVDLSDWLNY